MVCITPQRSRSVVARLQTAMGGSCCGEAAYASPAVSLGNVACTTLYAPLDAPIVGRMSEITDRAQQLLAGRIDAIRKLSDRQREATQAREVADSADRKVAAAWSEATQAGWSATELRKLGLTQPVSRRGGRPKGSRTTGRQENAGTDGSSSKEASQGNQ